MSSLLERYAEPHRHYHTWKHIDECLNLLASRQPQLQLSLEDYGTVVFVLQYHDVILDPKAQWGRNEAASATLAVMDILTRDPGKFDQAAEVNRLIMLTAGHRPRAGDVLGSIVVSIDLAILGARRERYAEYATDVRREYAHVADDQWRLGRGFFLRSTLEREPIFPHPVFEKDFGERARSNMTWELERLVST